MLSSHVPNEVIGCKSRIGRTCRASARYVPSITRFMYRAFGPATSGSGFVTISPPVFAAPVIHLLLARASDTARKCCNPCVDWASCEPCAAHAARPANLRSRCIALAQTPTRCIGGSSSSDLNAIQEQVQARCGCGTISGARPSWRAWALCLAQRRPLGPWRPPPPARAWDAQQLLLQHLWLCVCAPLLRWWRAADEADDLEEGRFHHRPQQQHVARRRAARRSTTRWPPSLPARQGIAADHHTAPRSQQLLAVPLTLFTCRASCPPTTR